MNKFFWQNFLMNEAGDAGADSGGGSPAAPAPAPADVPAPASDVGASAGGDTGGQAGGFSSSMFDDDAPDDKEQKPDAGSEQNPDAEKYDAEQAFADFKYNLPDGYSLSDDQQKQYIEMAKEKGIKPDQLQTFVDKHIDAQKAQIEQYRGIVSGWEQEVKADPVLGGDNFPTTKKNVNNACSLDGGQEFKQVLANVGLISNPAVVRYLNNLGSMINNDGLVVGSQVKNDQTQDLKSLYNKSNY